MPQNLSVPNVEQKKNWLLSPESFRKFLEWLDETEDSEGRRYLEMREKLVNYFDRKNCLSPDDLADETLNRAARRLEEEGAIETETPAKFCYTQARFVFLEYLRRKQKNDVSIGEDAEKLADKNALTDDADEKEKRLNCLEKCVGKLDLDNREMIIGYYFGEERTKIENRKSLAGKFGISANALTIRACRIREKLEKCVRNCVSEK